jgi:hypothetical protein
MKDPRQKSGIQWLLMAFAVIAVVLVIRAVGRNLATEIPGEAMASTEIEIQKEANPAPIETEKDDLAAFYEPVAELTDVAKPNRKTPKLPNFKSEKPLYFRLVFGEKGANPMLGAFDESSGTGTGYSVAYVDENNNGDLSDDPAKAFPRYESGSRKGQLNPRFEFKGPFKGKTNAKYTLYSYSLTRTRRVRAGENTNDYYFFWYLDTEPWSYMFINGKMRLSPSIAEAMTAPPVRLAGTCKWDISAKRSKGKAMVSAGLKDENGCTLRLLRRSGKTLSPRLSLIKDGKTILEESMKFG